MVVQLVTWLGIDVLPDIPLYCDDQSAIRIANNPMFHDRTKHIKVNYHLIRQEYEARRISLPYFPSKDQVVDLFTKAQTQSKFNYFLSKLSIFDPPWI